MEMIVATFVLAMAVVAAMTSFAASTRASSAAERYQTASLLAQRRFTEIELRPDTLAAGDSQGEFSAENAEYHWAEHVETTPYPKLFKVTVVVLWGEGSSAQEFPFTTYLSNQPLQDSSDDSQNRSGSDQGNAATGNGNANGSGQ